MLVGRSPVCPLGRVSLCFFHKTREVVNNETRDVFSNCKDCIPVSEWGQFRSKRDNATFPYVLFIRTKDLFLPKVYI